MKKRFILIVMFFLMTLPLYAGYYSSDYEDYIAGQPIAPQSGTWWVPAGDATVELDPAAPDPNNNQVIDISAGSASFTDDTIWLYGGVGQEPNDPFIIVEYDLYLSTDQVRSLTFGLVDNDTSDVIYAAFGRSGPDTISYVDSGVWLTVPYDYNAETWMRTRWVIDQNSDTFDLYVNGDLVIDGGGTWNNSISVERAVFYEDGSYTEKILIDNVVISGQIDEPAFPACGDGTHSWLPGDISGPGGERDCYVNMYDVAKMVAEWLLCTDPTNSSCGP